MNNTYTTNLTDAEMNETFGGIDIEINWDYIGEKLHEAAEFIADLGERLT